MTEEYESGTDIEKKISESVVKKKVKRGITSRLVTSSLLPSQLSNSEFMTGVTLTASDLYKSIDDQLKAVILLPTSRVRGGKLRGCAFVVDRKCTFGELADVNCDLNGCVSAYRLATDEEMTEKKLELLRERMRAYVEGSSKQQQQNIVDYSHHRIDPQNYNTKIGISGDDFSIGLYKNFDYTASFPRVNMYLVIRSAHKASSHAAWKELAQKNIEDAISDPLYKKAQADGDAQRDRLAMMIAENIGVRVDHYTEKMGDKNGGIAEIRFAKPICQNRYNYARPILFRSHNYYCFYSYCFSTADATGGILFGLGRNIGYYLLGFNSTDQDDKSIKNPEVAHAFPMGVDKLADRSLLLSQPTKTMDTMKKVIGWKGVYQHHHKAVPNMYRTDVIKNQEWFQLVKNYGYTLSDSMDLKVMYVFVNCTDERGMTFQEIMYYSTSDQKIIYIPVDNPIISKIFEMFSGAKAARGSDHKLTDLVKEENENYFGFSKARLMDYMRDVIGKMDQSEHTALNTVVKNLPK